MKKKRLLIIELNEFNEELLFKGAKTYNLKNITNFLGLKNSQTLSLDEIEHHGLDPWVQWGRIHSGLPFSKHHIARLGDTKRQVNKQIWNKIESY